MSAITINTKNQNSPFQNKPLSSSSQHDNKPSEDILGTIAGDDTIILILREGANHTRVNRFLSNIIPSINK